MKIIQRQCITLFLLLCVTLYATIVYAESSDVVNSPTGPIRGTTTRRARKYLGIPYAQPPLGLLRWQPPVEMKPWSDIYNATKYAPGCPQHCMTPPHTCPEVTSESCLFLDVFTPLNSSTKDPIPVMIFMHGGQFTMGAPGVELYDGELFVSKGNVILVNIAYRLGALGWLASSDANIPGNFGFLDQRAAIQWVHRNIRAFGGNPNSITIFGQSAGAISVAAHLTSPFSKGLFHKAIIESNPLMLPGIKTPEDNTKLARHFFKEVGCAIYDKHCLFNKTVTEILEAQSNAETALNLRHPFFMFLPWGFNIDNWQIPGREIPQFTQGNFINMPIMIGSVSEEARTFVFLGANFSVNAIEYAGALLELFGVHAPKVYREYPPESFLGDNRDIMSGLGTDYVFTAVCTL
jgi:carboxylesterase type B